MSNLFVRVAIVEDEPVAGKRLLERMTDIGYAAELFYDGESFLDRFDSNPHDLVVSDLKLPGIHGLEILKHIKNHYPETEVLITTGYGSIDTAIEAIRAGAFHYLTKPIRLDEFENLITRIIEKILLRKETQDLRASMMSKVGLEGIIGSSPQMNQVFRLIEKLAPLDCPVIIQGESGTGKELVARAIHRLSPRHNGPQISFNCGGFSQDLIANELFGHEKGAFTGAVCSKMGLLETANHGTVLLDEIVEMPSDMQVKLLRVLQEKQIYRVGGTRPIGLDIRILAASNQDIATEVEKGNFREDLFFRLNVLTISLPRLKDREGDLTLLMDYFLQKFNRSYGKKIKGFSSEAKDILFHHDFPGNIRELENIVSRAVVLAEGQTIGENDLPQSILKSVSMSKDSLLKLEEVEENYIRQVLEQTQGRRDEAARILGITRTTLWRKIKKFNLV